MQAHSSVTVEPVEGHPAAFWLRWSSYVAESDVRPAFRALTRCLDEANTRVHILVDLRSNPRLPLQTTISETMNGPFLHKNMGTWLVIGRNPRAEIVASVISRAGHVNSIVWFKTEQEALRHLETLEAQKIPAWD